MFSVGGVSTGFISSLMIVSRCVCVCVRLYVRVLCIHVVFFRLHGYKMEAEFGYLGDLKKLHSSRRAGRRHTLAMVHG